MAYESDDHPKIGINGWTAPDTFPYACARIDSPPTLESGSP